MGRPGALGQGLYDGQQLHPLRLAHRQRGQGRGGGRGGQDVDRSRVEIPAEAEARQWRAFREEVLKAMREGNYPEEYEREVERYYERLIR